MQRLEGELIIYLSSIDWDFNWQTHQEIASTLAQEGNVVLYVENTGVRVPRPGDLPRIYQRFRNWQRSVSGIRQVAERLYVCSPLVLPFPYSRSAQWVNRWLLSRGLKWWINVAGSLRPIVWTYLPTQITLDIIQELDPELVIYHCLADFWELAPRRKVSRTEKQLLKKADVVFAQGELLAERCRKVHPTVSVFPGGVNARLFLGVGTDEVPADLREIPRPRLGYIGALQRHLDYDLLISLARRHPDWSLVFVGPRYGVDPRLHALPNAVWLGDRSHEEIPRYVAHFDVCLIPYQLNAYTKTVYPSKLNEYLILGKPVVSTPLPEILSFNESHGGIVAVGRTQEEFERCVLEALRTTDGEVAAQRRAVAMQYDWPIRISQMSTIAAGVLREKRAQASREWSTILRQWYRHTRVRIVRLAATMVMVYMVMFYSPLLWWIAAPLKQVDAPRAADAIVVFAGGVGESGRAGQGYVERVARAIELYDQHLADFLVFSSGYVYTLNETELMKALAVSLGVPSSAIVLEAQARSTVENVKLTSAIAKQRGWRSFLLVSSPYHMRRSLLVFRKQAPELDVIAAPVLQSVFFNRSHGVQLKHWQAILHEYGGIVYYWLKGWA